MQHNPYPARTTRRSANRGPSVAIAAVLCLATLGSHSSSLSLQYGDLGGFHYQHGNDLLAPTWPRNHQLANREDDDDERDDIEESHVADRERDFESVDSDGMEIEAPPASPVVMGPIDGVLSSSSKLSRSPPVVTLDNVCDDALAYTMQYLPLQVAHRLRTLNRAFNSAVDRITYLPPFANGRLMFTRWLEPFVPKTVQPNAPPQPFVWLCAACGSASDNHQKCVCCHSPVERAACRVFLGQMPKRATAEAASHMIRVLLPGVEPLHIESHTMRSGHEKGCAWVYMRSVNDCQRLLTVNKRVFFDEADGYLGFWVVPEDDRMTLSRFAESRSAAARAQILPRNPLTSEFSIGSILRTTLEAASTAYADPSGWTRNEAGWYVPAAAVW